MAPSARSLGNARLSMLAKPRTLTSRADFAEDIRREWTNALEATVAVGRRLNEAKEALPHGDYQAMVENDLPFSTATARKLREIAEFVDRDKVPLDRLPEAMSTLYAIATLPDETRQQALEQGVIRPDITRAEVAALKAPPAIAVPPTPTETIERREMLKPGLEALFAGIPAPEDQSAPTMVKPQPPALPLLDREPAVIDGEAVRIDPPAPAPVVVLTAAEPVKGPNVAAMLSLPWSTDAEDAGAIVVELGGGKTVTLLVVVPNDPAAADVVRHVVQLHNATLSR